MSALPGTPALQNAIPMPFFGTTPFAAPGLGIVAGILVLNHPLFAAVLLPATLVIYLGVLGIVMGIFGIIGGFAGGGIGSFMFGVLNLLIGILLLSSPAAATLAVPFVFGILLLIEGVALIIWAFRVRA